MKKYLFSVLTGGMLGIVALNVVENVDCWRHVSCLDQLTYFKRHVEPKWIEVSKPTTLQSLINDGVLQIDSVKDGTMHMTTQSYRDSVQKASVASPE